MDQFIDMIDWFGGEEDLILRQERDTRKLEYCELNNLPLYVIGYWENIETKMEEIILSLYGENKL